MAKRKKAMLAIDEGTSGTRAAVVAEDGEISGLNYIPLKVDSPRNNVVEQDANMLLQYTLTVCKKTIANAVTNGIEIVALVIATQRATGVLWDTQTGEALVPAMVWQDTRYAEELKEYAKIWDKKLIPLTGRPLGGRAIYLWAARHIQNTPSVREAYRSKRLAFGTVDSWLLWNLSDKKQVVTTPTNATSAGAYILSKHEYCYEWLDAQKFPSELLPILKQDSDEFGFTCKEVIGIRVPIKASCGDQLGGLVGLGCCDAGRAMCVHGSGSFVDLMIGENLPKKLGLYDSTFVMTSWRKNNKSNYAVETYAATTGSAIN